MKQSDITPKIIELSKQIAEYWKMEIYEGCWVNISRDDTQKIVLATKVNCLGFYWRSPDMNDFRFFACPEDFPIPSISDALEKLRELDWCIEMTYICEPKIELNYVKGGERFKQIKAEGNTLHEALLSALLEVLKND